MLNQERPMPALKGGYAKHVRVLSRVIGQNMLMKTALQLDK